MSTAVASLSLVLRRFAFFERAAFWTLGALGLSLAALYGFFILHSVILSIERENLARQTAALESAVGELERALAIRREELSPDAAAAFGLGAPEGKTFVMRRGSSGGALSLNIE